MLSLIHVRNWLLLAATLFDTESGVYGYRRLMIWNLSPSGVEEIKFQKPVDFSDFGSWQWIGLDGYVIWWDYVYDPANEAHEGPHRYLVQVMELIDGKMVVGKSSETREKYNIGWTVNGHRPRIVPAKDPLREFGWEWRWWGDRSLQLDR